MLKPLAILCLIVATLGVRGEDKPTVDSVLERYVKAVGGKEAIEKTKSLLMEGEIEIGGAKGDAKSMRKAPNKTSWQIDFNGTIYAQGYDGRRGWKNDGSSVQELEGRELRALLRSAATPEETNLRTLYPKLEYKGVEKVNGEQADILESNPSTGISHRLAFSTKSGFLIGRTSKDGDAKSTMELSDYKAVDGVQRPHTAHEVLESPESSFEYTLRYKKITANGDVKDELFAQPK